MKRAEALKPISEQLIKRRDEIFRSHLQAEDARRSLTEPEVEFEETAQKESIADNLAQLDEKERQEIEAIDQALEKIKLGQYGNCSVCGKPISMKRLRVLPWTTLCTIHAKLQMTSRPQPQETKGALPPEYESLSGRELGEIIVEELREDGDLELEELRIAVRAGQLHLEGFLPSEAQRRRLLEIVQDHLEISNVVDEVVVTRAPWEREDRTPGAKQIEDVLDELEGEEEEVHHSLMASRKAGIPLTPPDTFEPEER